MNSINYKKSFEMVSDSGGIDVLIITDKNPIKKKGLSGYWIKVYNWYGKRKVDVIIEACWRGENYKSFTNLRDASNWLKYKLIGGEPHV